MYHTRKKRQFFLSFKKSKCYGITGCFKPGDLRAHSKESLRQVHLQRNEDAALCFFLNHVSYLEQKKIKH
jgi:hypothetical protein